MVDYEEEAKRLLQERDAVKSGVGSKSKEEKDGIAALAARLPNLKGEAAINAAVEEEAAKIVSARCNRAAPDAVPDAQPVLTTLF
jgi:hypothetical protein